MAWANLVRGRYKASLEISDSDVEAQLQLHKPDQTKPNRLRIHHAADRSDRAARFARRRLRSAQTRCRGAARRGSPIATKAFHSPARSPKSRCATRSRSFPPTCAPATARNSRQHGGRPPDAAGDRPRRACRCSPSATRRRTKSETPEMREDPRPDVPAEIRRQGQALSRKSAPRGDDRIQIIGRSGTQECQNTDCPYSEARRTCSHWH